MDPLEPPALHHVKAAFGWIELGNVPEALAELNTAFDRVDAQYREKLGIKPGRSMNLLDYIGLDDAFLELLDLPTTFPKVWSILGQCQGWRVPGCP